MDRRATSKSRDAGPPGNRTTRALRERAKELSCLYRIRRIFEEAADSPDEVLQRIAGLIPPAWQYPEITAARIEIGRAHV